MDGGGGGGGGAAEVAVVLSGTRKQNPQDLACLNNPKLFFNHTLENWLGPSAGGGCASPSPFNEIH